MQTELSVNQVDSFTLKGWNSNVRISYLISPREREELGYAQNWTEEKARGSYEKSSGYRRTVKCYAVQKLKERNNSEQMVLSIQDKKKVNVL